MKKRFLCAAIGILMLMSTLFTGCNEQMGASVQTSGVPTETKPAGDNKPEEKEGLRVLITSDMHYTSIEDYYGITKGKRLKYWADGINAEHEKEPLDLIIILGDMSLDYWGWNGGGTYQRNPSVSETAEFMEKYVSQLPKDVPVVVLPGNHELYTNDKWKEITGNNRSETFVLGNNLFIMPDSYAGAVDPAYEGGGKNDSPYKAVDVDFIRNAMAQHPECNNVFLLSHHFDMNAESEEFKQLLSTENRIKALFSGHTHGANTIELGTQYRNLLHIKTGSFASYGAQNNENFNWGYRDLLIDEKEILTRYIRPQCSCVLSGNNVKEFTRAVLSTVKIKK